MQDCPPGRIPSAVSEEVRVFIIGVDPHKASHTAAVLDGDEQLVGEIRVRADRSQRDRLLEFAAPRSSC